MEIIKLEELSTEQLMRIDAWQIVEELGEGDGIITPKILEDYEGLITPADKDKDGLISRDIGGVWCLTYAIFANGDKHIACSLCEGDSDEGPICWSVWNGVDFVVLMVPPAPDFVLEVDGPDHFCSDFGKSIHDVFPLTFEVVPLFQNKPHQRKVVIQPDGKKVYHLRLNPTDEE